MSEMKYYQILRLNYYKKLKEWWTDNVDGNCVSFICIETQNIKFNSFVKKMKMERRFQKRRVLPDLSTIFFLEELTQIEWSISKKRNNG